MWKNREGRENIHAICHLSSELSISTVHILLALRCIKRQVSKSLFLGGRLHGSFQISPIGNWTSPALLKPCNFPRRILESVQPKLHFVIQRSRRKTNSQETHKKYPSLGLFAFCWLINIAIENCHLVRGFTHER